MVNAALFLGMLFTAGLYGNHQFACFAALGSAALAFIGYAVMVVAPDKYIFAGRASVSSIVMAGMGFVALFF